MPDGSCRRLSASDEDKKACEEQVEREELRQQLAKLQTEVVQARKGQKAAEQLATEASKPPAPDCAKLEKAEDRAACALAELEEIKKKATKPASAPTTAQQPGSAFMAMPGMNAAPGTMGQVAFIAPVPSGPSGKVQRSMSIYVDNRTEEQFVAVPPGFWPWQGDQDKFVPVHVFNRRGQEILWMIPPRTEAHLVPIVRAVQGPFGHMLPVGLGERTIVFETYTQVAGGMPFVPAGRVLPITVTLPCPYPGMLQGKVVDALSVGSL
jgi:hypothetical protein